MQHSSDAYEYKKSLNYNIGVLKSNNPCLFSLAGSNVATKRRLVVMLDKEDVISSNSWFSSIKNYQQSLLIIQFAQALFTNRKASQMLLEGQIQVWL